MKFAEGYRCQAIAVEPDRREQIYPVAVSVNLTCLLKAQDSCCVTRPSHI